MAKGSAKKAGSGKSAGAKKSSGKKAAGTKKLAAGRAAGTATSTDKPKRPPKSGGRRRDPPPPPLWITGTLAVQGGVIGLQASGGFISLQEAADEGHMVTLVFQPSAGEKTAAVQTMLDKLAEFIEAYGVGNIPGGLTCCGGP